MNGDPKYCPNPKCPFAEGAHEGFFLRRGTYSAKCHGGAITQKYECKGCKRIFSDQSFSPERCQKRPDINGVLARLLCEGVTLRGCARVLDVSYDTIRARSAWLAEQARAAHETALKDGKLNTGWLQFDEMVAASCWPTN